jgi:hypothetical protein
MIGWTSPIPILNWGRSRPSLFPVTELWTTTPFGPLVTGNATVKTPYTPIQSQP